MLRCALFLAEVRTLNVVVSLAKHCTCNLHIACNMYHESCFAALVPIYASLLAGLLPEVVLRL